ncbi:hypothetical protein [uncultured Psychrosphaera sp.]|uniref:hypothetical protein n=1 Tax=uncultured Psychrosphaera sp. TaxID=1403522 RepID=UPI0026291042|nr:hypothetical protein [uncultured Psychrosphaera sp.]
MPLTINENLIMNEQVQDLLDGKSVDIGDCVSEHGQGVSLTRDDVRNRLTENPEFESVMLALESEHSGKAIRLYKELFTAIAADLIEEAIKLAIDNKELPRNYLDEAA